MRSRTYAAAAALTCLTALAFAASRAEVDQMGQVFSRAALTIKKETVVVFNNHDDVTHNISVYDSDGDGADLGLQKPGVSLSYKFDAQGRFTVRCSIHPSMKMTIEVH